MNSTRWTLAIAAAVALAFIVQSGPKSLTPAPAPLATVAAVAAIPAPLANAMLAGVLAVSAGRIYRRRQRTIAAN